MVGKIEIAIFVATIATDFLVCVWAMHLFQMFHF